MAKEVNLDNYVSEYAMYSTCLDVTRNTAIGTIRPFGNGVIAKEWDIKSKQIINNNGSCLLVVAYKHIGLIAMLCLMPEVASINNTLGSCLINTLAGMQCKYY